MTRLSAVATRLTGLKGLNGQRVGLSDAGDGNRGSLPRFVSISQRFMLRALQPALRPHPMIAFHTEMTGRFTRLKQPLPLPRRFMLDSFTALVR